MIWVVLLLLAVVGVGGFYLGGIRGMLRKDAEYCILAKEAYETTQRNLKILQNHKNTLSDLEDRQLVIERLIELLDQIGVPNSAIQQLLAGKRDHA